MVSWPSQLPMWCDLPMLSMAFFPFADLGVFNFCTASSLLCMLVFLSFVWLLSAEHCPTLHSCISHRRKWKRQTKEPDAARHDSTDAQAFPQLPFGAWKQAATTGCYLQQMAPCSFSLLLSIGKLLCPALRSWGGGVAGDTGPGVGACGMGDSI